MDSERLPEALGLTDQDIESLSNRGLVRRRLQKPRPKDRVDYEALRHPYGQMLQGGAFPSRAKLALPPERPGVLSPWPINFHHGKYILEIYTSGTPGDTASSGLIFVAPSTDGSPGRPLLQDLP